jgi:excisionase family DNA binding protein
MGHRLNEETECDDAPQRQQPNMGTSPQPSSLTHLLTSAEVELLHNELHAVANQVVDAFLAARLGAGYSLAQGGAVENGNHQDYVAANKTTNNLLTVKEVAGILKLSVRKVWRLAAEGKLPAPVKIGRSSRWLASEVDAYLNTVISERKI